MVIPRDGVDRCAFSQVLHTALIWDIVCWNDGLLREYTYDESSCRGVLSAGLGEGAPIDIWRPRRIQRVCGRRPRFRAGPRGARAPGFRIRRCGRRHEMRARGTPRSCERERIRAQPGPCSSRTHPWRLGPITETSRSIPARCALTLDGCPNYRVSWSDGGSGGNLGTDGSRGACIWGRLVVHRLDDLCSPGARRYDEAMELSMRSLKEQPGAGHSAHARAHAHYETADHDAGLAWMDSWVHDEGAATHGIRHFSWHAALHELFMGDLDAVRRRYEAELLPSPDLGGANTDRHWVAAVAMGADSRRTRCTESARSRHGGGPGFSRRTEESISRSACSDRVAGGG
ncbi:hypothetical protein ABMA10_00335 [Plantibacter sp. RU18]